MFIFWVILHIFAHTLNGFVEKKSEKSHFCVKKFGGFKKLLYFCSRKGNYKIAKYKI